MIDLARLNDIAQTVLSGEYHMFLSMYRGASGTETVRCTLEKGSTYSKFHLKVEATGETPSEAFENALRQFPLNPLVGHWDTDRLAAPIIEGEFNETTD